MQNLIWFAASYIQKAVVLKRLRFKTICIVLYCEAGQNFCSDLRQQIRSCLRARKQVVLACVSKIKLLVGLDGLEPSTSRLSGARSNHLSYRPVSFGFLRFGPVGIVEIFPVEMMGI